MYHMIIICNLLKEINSLDKDLSKKLFLKDTKNSTTITNKTPNIPDKKPIMANIIISSNDISLFKLISIDSKSCIWLNIPKTSNTNRERFAVKNALGRFLTI